MWLYRRVYGFVQSADRKTKGDERQVTDPGFGNSKMISRRDFLAAMAGVASLIVLPLSACSKNTDESFKLGSPTVFVPTIVSEGELRVGVFPHVAPLAATTNDQQKQIRGIDIDIAAAMAEQVGLKLVIVDVTNRVINELFLQKEIDIFMGYSPDPPDPFALVGPYLVDAPAIFAKGYSAPSGGFDISSLYGHKIAVRSGSLPAHMVEAQFGAEAVQAYPTDADAFRALNNGTVTYLAADILAGSFAATVEHDGIICLGFLVDAPNEIYIAVAAGNQEMTDVVTKNLRDLRNDGRLSAIVKAWLGKTATNLVLGSKAISGAGQPVDSGDDLPDPSNSDSAG